MYRNYLINILEQHFTLIINAKKSEYTIDEWFGLLVLGI